MPGKSMRGDESKKMSKEKPIQNTEKKRTDISHRIIWKPVKEKRKRKKKKEKEKGKRKRKKKKEKEKEKGKTASVSSDPLGRERAGPIRSALAIWD